MTLFPPHRGDSESLPLVERAHPDLGRLGVFWHTQGSGKSYSMAFFAQKVRRVVPGNFTFVVMTDREDLDDQIFRTFVGCGVADEQTPRAVSGRTLNRCYKRTIAWSSASFTSSTRKCHRISPTASATTSS